MTARFRELEPPFPEGQSEGPAGRQFQPLLRDLAWSAGRKTL